MYRSFFSPDGFFRAYANDVQFEPRTETGIEHFAHQDSGPSETFKLIVFTSEKILYNINVVVRRRLKN